MRLFYTQKTMLAKNKNFRESYSQESDSEDELEDEKTFESFGFEKALFPEHFMVIAYPSFILWIEHFVQRFKFCDVIVMIGKERFNCHFIVMRCYSRHFERYDKSTTVIELPIDQVTPKAFCEIYEWMLSTENIVKRESFAEVFKAVRFLQVDKLLQQLMIIIDDQQIISEREALSIFLEAKRFSAKCLQSFMVGKISRIFLTFVASKEFLECSLDEANELFRSNRIAVNSEVDMIFIAIRWLLYKWPRRRNYIKQILTQIKFELIVPWQLIEFKKYPQHLEQIFYPKEIQNAIDEALAYQSTRRMQLLADGNVKQQDRLVVPRRIILDPLWLEYKFEENSNIHIGYHKFKEYLKRLNACHWTQLKYQDNKYSSIKF